MTVVLDRCGSAEDLDSEKVERDWCGGANVGDVDHGVDVADVDDGTNVDDVDDGANVDDVDDGAEVDDVDHSTDVDDGSAFQKCFHLNTSPSSIPLILAATLKKTVTSSSSSLLVPFILFDVVMFAVVMLLFDNLLAMDPPSEETFFVSPNVEPESSSIDLSTQSNAPPRRPPLAKTSSSGRTTSKAWDHFEKIKGIDGKDRAMCKYCKKEYIAGSKSHGTSNLLSHLKNCTKYPYRDTHGQQSLGFKPKEVGGEDVVDVVTTPFSVEVARRHLAEMIVIDDLPFRFVDGVGFKRFCNVMQPKFKIPSRYTVARDILDIYTSERERLKKIVKWRKICFTTDTWTSIQNLCYMCLTAHFIDDDWKLQKWIINFCQIEDHKGETLGKKIEALLKEWDIDGLFTLTVDNASSNNLTIRFLKRTTKLWKGTILGHEFLHMRFCAHILNLIVSDGLKDLESCIVNVRHTVRYVRSSPNCLDTFKKYVEPLKIESKSLLCLDVSTRWNSTYLMLEAAEKFESAYQRMGEEDYNYKHYFLDNEGGERREMPTAEDWDNCRVLLKFLRMFYNATKRFSGSLFVTSNTFYTEIFVIENMIGQLIKDNDPILSSMAKKMKEKFDKYWRNGDKINLLLYVTVVLDPRRKMTYLQFCFSTIFGGDMVKVKEMLDKVKNCLGKLYDHYATLEPTNVHVSNVNERVDMVIDENDPHTIVNSQFNSFLEGQFCSSGSMSELDKYLGDIEKGGNNS
ncbi:zinc finger BED domain-containing protein RICESLEEPER 1-like [Camellia sinensis]|uniref:zinc finger BED domain-containing protein RICESLEEPER 1-like n=1 Tax=Camellia sinensis TaxID=4442 RepID=UPI001035A3E3|nr:zinc finger BED domain-containing protein RICESLEEPER 1-like [Camellia sinensis]